MMKAEDLEIFSYNVPSVSMYATFPFPPPMLNGSCGHEKTSSEMRFLKTLLMDVHKQRHELDLYKSA